MQDVTVRLFIQNDSGRFESNYSDFNLSQFAGVIPCIGDQFLHPGVYAAGGPAARRHWGLDSSSPLSAGSSISTIIPITSD